MRGQEFHVRDKKVQKMTRDGLTQQNLTRGTQQRISSRLEDISFARDKPGDAAADIRDGQQQKRMRQNPAVLQNRTRFQSGAGNGLTSGQKEAVQPTDTAVPEVCGAQNVLCSHDINNRSLSLEVSYDAGDSPVISDSSYDTGDSSVISDSSPDAGSRQMMSDISQNIGRNISKKSCCRTVPANGKTRNAEQGTKIQPESGGMKVSIPDMSRGQLKFEPEKSRETADRSRASMKKRQTAKFAADRARVEVSAQSEPDRNKEAVLVTDHKEFKYEPRLKFEPEEMGKTAQKDWALKKKRQTAKFAADRVRVEISAQSELDRSKKAVLVTDHEEFKYEPHLKFEPEEMGKTAQKDQVLKKQAAKFAVYGVGPADKKESAVCSGKLETEVHTEPAPQALQKTNQNREPAGKSRQQKKYEKAQKRVEKAERKLEKAQARLPTHRRVCLTGQDDSGTGKVGHRLHFEAKIIPENEKPPLAKRTVKAAGQTVTSMVSLKIHQKIRENEQDNTGVEAVHKVEYAAERGAVRYLRHRKHRLHEKPYREVCRAEKRMSAASADMAYQKLLMDKTELPKNAFSRWLQKQKLRQKYAATVREAAKGARYTTNVLTATGQIIRALAQTVASKKTVIGIIAVGMLVMSMFGALFSSCSAMITGVQSAIVSTCYVAEDSEINASELAYTELETDLQIAVDNTENDYPGYDEYRYSIGEIGHSPYELMGYLSAVYDDFTHAQVAGELSRLFGLQYELAREEITETRTYIDEEGQEQEYEWHVLKTTLSVKPLSEIIAVSLPSGDPADRYEMYMQTCGNRQCYGNPFDSAWISHVTSPYGYRIHPVSGEKDLHCGIDIGAVEGTPILAVQDGRVVSAGDAGAYGLCVVVEGEDGYQSRYAHCSSLSVSAGQEVKQGDVIAAVGSTGTSTGAHLHLEVTHNGEYLNPYFYVDNGGGGYLPGGGAAQNPDFSENPGDAMGDGSFAAMLEEAEKYLGFPYVWGGSSPSTSFDCSGYVSWVVNHSGVGSVGRQTAQGLFNLCTPVSRADMQPGDLVFFTGTYSTANPVTHVGIYVGGGRMIHCGSPISYASIDGNYWSSKFYSGGRLP